MPSGLPNALSAPFVRAGLESILAASSPPSFMHDESIATITSPKSWIGSNTNFGSSGHERCGTEARPKNSTVQKAACAGVRAWGNGQQ